MIKPTRLVDHLKLLEQNIKDAKALSGSSSLPSKVNKLEVLEQGTHQILTNQANKIKHSKDHKKKLKTFTKLTRIKAFKCNNACTFYRPHNKK